MLNYLNEATRIGQKTAVLEWLLFANEDPDLHNNVLFFGFPPEEDEPTHVAKQCRSPINNHTIRNEYERLGDLWNALGQEAVNLSTQPLALVEHEENLILMMSYCAGKTLQSRLYRLRQDDGQMEQLWSKTAVLLRTIHQQTAVSYPTTPFPFNFQRMADKFSQLFSLSTEEIETLDSLRETINNIQSNTAVLLHGDFWSGNIILRSSDAAFMLIDWQYARWSLDASLDVYLFPLVCAIQAIPYQQATAHGMAAADVLIKWQEKLIPSYLQTYGDAFDYNVLSMRAGLLSVCVEMAVRPSLTFNIMQEDALLWRTLFAELNKQL